MRLTCPNCGAVYEVDDNAIPPDGRDVQCSSCGHGWFQPRADDGAEPAAALGSAASPFAGEDAPDEAGAAAGEHDEPGHATPGEGAADVSPRRPRHRMDEAVRSILREEAERETRSRRTGPDHLESQSDLGLARGTGGPGQAHADDAAGKRQMPGDEDRQGDGAPHPVEPEPWEENDPGPDAGHGARFANIEDVNETIAAHEAPGADRSAFAALPEAETAPRRNRFGLGLGIALLVGAGAVAVYLYAPLIVKLVPASEPFLADYVRVADTMRADLRQAVLPVAEWLRGLLGGTAG